VRSSGVSLGNPLNGLPLSERRHSVTTSSSVAESYFVDLNVLPLTRRPHSVTTSSSVEESCLVDLSVVAVESFKPRHPVFRKLLDSRA
jgi:hypothetical protein